MQFVAAEWRVAYEKGLLFWLPLIGFAADGEKNNKACQEENGRQAHSRYRLDFPMEPPRIAIIL